MADISCTNRDIWQALVHPVEIAKPGALPELVALDTPLPASNLLRRSLRLAQGILSDIEGERNKLVTLYVHTEKDEQGNETQRIDPEFFVEFEKLMDIPVTLPGAEVVRVKDLGKVEFSGSKLNLLMPTFVQDETAPPKPALVK